MTQKRKNRTKRKKKRKRRKKNERKEKNQKLMEPTLRKLQQIDQKEKENPSRHLSSRVIKQIKKLKFPRVKAKRLEIMPMLLRTFKKSK